MKIQDLFNLYVGYNEKENYTILIGAYCEQDASRVAEKYREDSSLDGSFEIKEFNDINTEFDCDYVVM